MLECDIWEMYRVVEKSLGTLAKYVEVKFLSVYMIFFCNFKVGGC